MNIVVLHNPHTKINKGIPIRELLTLLIPVPISKILYRTVSSFSLSCDVIPVSWLIPKPLMSIILDKGRKTTPIIRLHSRVPAFNRLKSFCLLVRLPMLPFHRVLLRSCISTQKPKRDSSCAMGSRYPPHMALGSQTVCHSQISLLVSGSSPRRHVVNCNPDEAL